MRLAAAEAAVDESPVLLAADEHLPYVGEDPWQFLRDGGCDNVVVHQPLHGVRLRVGIAQPHNKTDRPDVLRAGQVEGLGDGHAHATSLSSRSSGPWLWSARRRPRRSAPAD